MTTKNLARIVEILASFGEGRASQPTAGLLAALGIPVSSGYKLIAALLESELLRKVGPGVVALGPAARRYLFSPIQSLPAHAHAPVFAGTGRPPPGARALACDPGLLDLTPTARFRKAPPYAIGFVNASLANPWRVAMASSLAAAAQRQRGVVRLIVRDARDDPALQAAQLYEMQALGVDLCICSAAASAHPALEAAIADLAGRGMPIVGIDRLCGDPGKLVSMVSASDRAIGRLSALWLAEMLQGRGHILLLGGRADASPCQTRLRAALAVFAGYPDIVAAPVAYTDWDPARARAIVAQQLRAGAVPAGVWSDCGMQAVGSVQAFRDAGFAAGAIAPHTGGDINAMYQSAVQNKVPLCAVDYPAAMGALSVQVALAILDGRLVARSLATNLEVAITRGHETSSVKADVLVEQKVRWDRADDYVHGGGWAPRAAALARHREGAP